MTYERRIPLLAVLLGAAAFLLVLAAPAAAGDQPAKMLTPEQYIEQAQPYLHLSCRGAWEAVEENADAYIDIVNKLSAIGFLNHEFDVGKLQALPAEKLEAVRVDFYNEIGDLCRKDPGRLLAGVVDFALVDTFAKLDAETKGE